MEDQQVQEQPRKRMLTERQKEALREGRQRRWESLGVTPPGAPDEPEPTPIPQQSQQQSKPSHPFFDLNSSDSSDSEESDQEQLAYGQIPQPPQSKTKKPKIPSAIKRRVDRYIQQKLQESAMGSVMTIGGPSTIVPQQPSYRLQYL